MELMIRNALDSQPELDLPDQSPHMSSVDQDVPGAQREPGLLREMISVKFEFLEHEQWITKHVLSLETSDPSEMR